jgi:DNA polymerase-3 subunit epsilon
MLESLFSHFNQIVIFDTETTGINHKTEEIIEFAAISITPGDETNYNESEIDVLIRLSDGRKLPGEITRLTGITEQMLLQDGESKEAVCEKITGILDKPKTLLVAYNAQFDLCFLYFFLVKFGCADVLKQVRLLDALAIYKDRRDYPHKLSDAIKTYNLENQNSHRAIDDAKATLELLVAMEREKDDLYKYVNLFGYNPKYGAPKPKISSVKYVPQGYDRQKRLYE